MIIFTKSLLHLRSQSPMDAFHPVLVQMTVWHTFISGNLLCGSSQQ